MKAVPDSQARETSSSTNIRQGAAEAYIDFIDHLQEAIERQIDNDRAAEALLWQLAYENANKDCRAIIGPLRTSTKDISEFIKACQDICTKHYKASLLAAAVKGESPLGIVPTVARAGIGQRNTVLNSTKTANPFRETPKEVPAPALPTPVGAFRTTINIRECREMQFPTFVQPPSEVQGWTWSPPMSSP